MYELVVKHDSKNTHSVPKWLLVISKTKFPLCASAKFGAGLKMRVLGGNFMLALTDSASETLQPVGYTFFKSQPQVTQSNS